MILRRILLVNWPWALSLDEDIYNVRNSYTSHATENIDYLTLIYLVVLGKAYKGA